MEKNSTLSIQGGYNIAIIGRHVMVTEAMKSYAIDKIAKLERLAIPILDLHINMDIQKNEHRVDIVIKLNHLKVKVHASSDDMYVSTDRAIEKLQHQIRRYKERLRDHHAKGLSVLEMNVSVLSPPSNEEMINDDIETYSQDQLLQIYRPHQVVKNEIRPLKTLSREDAIMKMELSQDAFIIYNCEESRKLKVIYRRSDGNYGIIEPEK
jgi:putative sigma-54 modulation protein